jgi:DamX protein
MTDHDAKDSNSEPEFATHLRDESSEAPDAAAPSPAAMQDMQLSLVDRIADVDDERRRSSTQLRKALQTHKDEVEQRLVGYRRTLIALSALAGLLTVGVIGLGLSLYTRGGEVAQQIANIDTLVSDSNKTSAQTTDQLATQVADIDLKLARLSSQLGDVAPAELSDSVEWLIGQIEGMNAKLQSVTALTSGLDADNMTAIDSGAADLVGDQIDADVGTGAPTEVGEDTASMADIDPGDQTDGLAALAESPLPRPTSAQTGFADRNQPMPDPAPEPSPEPSPEQAAAQSPDRIGMQADAAELKAEQQRLEAQIAATRNEHIGSQQSGTLPMDQLIDDQLERLEREYHRLARQVDAPAVQAAGAQPSAGASLASGAPLAPSADATTSAANDSSSDAESGGMTTQQPQIALQLIGVRSRDEVRAFIVDYALPGPLYLRSETFRGRPWYALIYSLHKDMESATAARDALPTDLAQLDLWLRELPAGTDLERIGADANN